MVPSFRESLRNHFNNMSSDPSISITKDEELTKATTTTTTPSPLVTAAAVDDEAIALTTSSFSLPKTTSSRNSYRRQRPKQQKKPNQSSSRKQPEDSSSSSGGRTRTVSFDEKVHIRKSRHIKNFTPKEINACWYSMEEILTMRSENRQRFFFKKEKDDANDQRGRLKERLSSSSPAKSTTSLLGQHRRIVLDNTSSTNSTSSHEPVEDDVQIIIQSDNDNNDATIKSLNELKHNIELKKQQVCESLMKTELQIQELQRYRNSMMKECESGKKKNQQCVVEGLDSLLSSTDSHIQALMEHRNMLRCHIEKMMI